MSWRGGVDRLFVRSRFRNRECVNYAGLFLVGGSVMGPPGVFRLARSNGFTESSALKKLHSMSHRWESAASVWKYWEKGRFDRCVTRKAFWGNRGFDLFLEKARDASKIEWKKMERIFDTRNNTVELKLFCVQNDNSKTRENAEIEVDREKENSDSRSVGDDSPSGQQERALIALPPKQVKKLNRGWMLFRFLYLTMTYLANATAIYYLYSQVFPEDRLTGFLAYGTEFMRSIPLFDLAQMSRVWVALPIGCLLLNMLSIKRLVPRKILILVNISYLILHFYRNYEILFHMGHFTWPLLILMSLRLTSWFVFIELGLNAPELYKLYPIHQYDGDHLRTRTVKLLDGYSEDPSSIPEHGWLMVKVVLFARAVWSYGVIGVEKAQRAKEKIKEMVGWKEEGEEKQRTPEESD